MSRKWVVNIWRTSQKSHTLSLTLLTLLIAISYPAWWLPGAPGFDDLSRLNVPQRLLLRWFYEHLHIPLWNPFNFAGQPFLAAGQSGPLYLPNIIFLVAPVVTAMKASYLFHEWLAAVGTYSVVYVVTRSRMGSIIGGLAFATSGFLIGHQIHTQMFDAMSWFPLSFALMLKLLQDARRRWMALLAFAFAMEVYAGHPQISFYLVVTMGLYLLLHIAQNRTFATVKVVLRIILSLTLGGLLSAAQWLPTLNLVSYSDRAAVSSQFLLKGSFNIIDFLQYITPFAAGGGYTSTAFSEQTYTTIYHLSLFWETTSYVGLITLLLAISVAVLQFRTNEFVRNMTIIALIAITLSLGGNAFGSIVLTKFPGFDLFRIPARYVGIVDFCLAILAGIGIHHLVSRPMQQTFRKALSVVSMILLTLLVLAHATGAFAHSPEQAFWVPVAALIGVVLLSVFAASQRSLAVMLASVSILDNAYHAFSLSPFILQPAPDYVTIDPAQMYLRQHLDNPLVRVAALDETSLSFDKSAPFQISTINGYDSLEPMWYAKHVDLTWSPETLLYGPRSVLDALDVKYVVTSSVNSAAATYLPVKSQGIQHWMHWIPHIPNSAIGVQIDVHASPQISVSYGALFRLTLISGQHVFVTNIKGFPSTTYYVPIPKDWPRDAATQVVINNEAWAQSYVIDRMSFVSVPEDRGVTIDVGAKLGPKPWKVVYHTADATIFQNPDAISDAWMATTVQTPWLQLPATTQMTSSGPNTENWSVSASKSGYFVLSQMYDPNWQVKVDGQPAKVIPIGTDGLLTGVAISEGTHTLQFTYLPQSFVIGTTLSLLGLGTIMFMFIPRQKRKRNPYKN